MFENLQKAVQRLEDNLTLKSDYTEELIFLDNIYSDIAVMRTMGVPVWKCQDLRNEIKRIREWIKCETA